MRALLSRLRRWWRPPAPPAVLRAPGEWERAAIYVLAELIGVPEAEFHALTYRKLHGLDVELLRGMDPADASAWRYPDRPRV